MPRFRVPYPPEFRRQMVELVRSGRTPEDLAREFEPRRSRSRTGLAKRSAMPVSAATAVRPAPSERS
jgi:transposase-like protein